MIFRYVIHERVSEYLNLGWIVCADLGPVHGQWSVLMRWLCECPYVEPNGK